MKTLGRFFHGWNFYDAPAALASDDLSFRAERSGVEEPRLRYDSVSPRASSTSLGMTVVTRPSLLLEDLHRLPLGVRWSLFVLERALKVHLRQQIVGVKFKET